LGTHLKGPVALAVDDEPQILRLIVRCLEFEGFQVLTAHSRAEAEQAVEDAGSIDVLVTDIFLGDGWGGELAFTLREERPTLPVVFISGRAAEDPILRHGIQEDMVFLEKPFTIVALADAVRKAMATQSNSDSNP
jgi:two-component system cell cycle sensor histidine kinase/response regulator CckA